MPVPEKIVLIGAGLTGPLLATYLAKHGFDVEISEFGSCFETPEFIEGTTAFMEKRKANF